MAEKLFHPTLIVATSLAEQPYRIKVKVFQVKVSILCQPPLELSILLARFGNEIDWLNINELVNIPPMRCFVVGFFFGVSNNNVLTAFLVCLVYCINDVPCDVLTQCPITCISCFVRIFAYCDLTPFFAIVASPTINIGEFYCSAHLPLCKASWFEFLAQPLVKHNENLVSVFVLNSCHNRIKLKMNKWWFQTHDAKLQRMFETTKYSDLKIVKWIVNCCYLSAGTYTLQGCQ